MRNYYDRQSSRGGSPYWVIGIALCVVIGGAYKLAKWVLG